LVVKSTSRRLCIIRRILPDFSLFPPLEGVLKGQRFASAGEDTAKVTGALPEVSKIDFQKCFQTFYKHCLTFNILFGITTASVV
jgi:hypothetical protein